MSLWVIFSQHQCLTRRMNRYSEVVLTSRNGMECGNEPLGDIFAAPVFDKANEQVQRGGLNQPERNGVRK